MRKKVVKVGDAEAFIPLTRFLRMVGEPEHE